VSSLSSNDPLHYPKKATSLYEKTYSYETFILPIRDSDWYES
jgi:hypothetical protein